MRRDTGTVCQSQILVGLAASGKELKGLCYVQWDTGSPGRVLSKGVRQSDLFTLLHLILPREEVPNYRSLFRLLEQKQQQNPKTRWLKQQTQISYNSERNARNAPRATCQKTEFVLKTLFQVSRGSFSHCVLTWQGAKREAPVGLAWAVQLYALCSDIILKSILSHCHKYLGLDKKKIT